MSIGTLGVMERMSQKNNKDLKVSPLSNIMSARSGKDGWGSVTIAMPNEIVVGLLTNPNRYLGGLLICSKEEFEKEKTLAESEVSECIISKQNFQTAQEATCIAPRIL